MLEAQRSHLGRQPFKFTSHYLFVIQLTGSALLIEQCRKGIHDQDVSTDKSRTLSLPLMHKTHIVLLGPAWPYRGGPALFMTFLYESLSRDFHVDFVNFRMMYPSLLFPGTTTLDLSQEYYQKVPGPRLLHSLNPWYWWQTARHIRRLNPDLIVFDWYQPFFGPMYFGIGFFLPKRLRQRILFITENVISHEARKVDHILTKVGLFWSNGFLALSDQVAKDIKAFSHHKPVFRSELPIFIGYRNDPNQSGAQCRKAFGFHPDDKVLLFFGYIRHYKGLDLLLDSLVLLLQKDPTYALLIAGESYEDVGPITTFIAANNLSERVVFENSYIDNEAVYKWFKASDVVLLPYRSATQSGILNMAYGFEKPVVCTDVGGLSEFIEDGKTGVLVPEATATSIAQGIKRFYNLKETTDFAALIRARAARNGFAQIGSVFTQIMEQLKK